MHKAIEVRVEVRVSSQPDDKLELELSVPRKREAVMSYNVVNATKGSVAGIMRDIEVMLTTLYGGIPKSPSGIPGGENTPTSP